MPIDNEAIHPEIKNKTTKISHDVPIRHNEDLDTKINNKYCNACFFGSSEYCESRVLKAHVCKFQGFFKLRVAP